MVNIEKLIEKCVLDFCKEFVESPYLCYTEHGLHARFYYKLLSVLPEDILYFKFEGEKVCVAQKEYRTRENLEKSKRQGWDIAIVDKTKISSSGNAEYDYLPLLSVVEFGLNASIEHLEDDVKRLSHQDANISSKRFIVHFYRISETFSHRDFSPRSKQINKIEDIREKLKNKPADIDIYFGVFDITGKKSRGLWIISKDKVTTLINENCEKYEEKKYL